MMIGTSYLTLGITTIPGAPIGVADDSNNGPVVVYQEGIPTAVSVVAAGSVTTEGTPFGACVLDGWPCAVFVL